MASHEQMKEQLVSLALGELSEPRRSEVGAHAVECDQCRAELRRIEQVLQCAGRRRGLSGDEPLYESAKSGLLAAVSGEEEPKTTARPVIRRAFRWRITMTSSIAKIAIAASVVIAVGLFGLLRPSATDDSKSFRGLSLLTKACAAEESLFNGTEIVHIQNEIIVYAGSSDLPAGLDFVWLPMCPVKPDGQVQFNQLKLSAATESYVVTDHSWHDPATGRFSRILKTGDAVVFANSYDGQFVYDATVTSEGVVQVVKQAISGAFRPPQSPAEYLGIAPGLKTALAEDDTMVQSVEQGALHDGKPGHIYKVGMPDPNGRPTNSYWLFKVRDEDSTIAEKEFILLGRPRLLVRRVLTESVQAPTIFWNLAEIEGTGTQASQQVSITPDMVIPRVSVEHMVERADFETYVFSTQPAWTGAIEITDCIDPASPGGRMFIMTARADDGRHLVLVQSPTYNKMLGTVVKQGNVVYTSPNGFKVWGGGPQKWYAQILLQSARASIKDPPSEDRIGYVLESPAGTFPALAVNGPISEEELHSLADSLAPAKKYLSDQAVNADEK
jgi:hypothetical protein